MKFHRLRVVIRWSVMTCVVCLLGARAEEIEISAAPLPALRIHGQVAHAHTQGLELVDGKFLVTARQEDVSPKRALLLRTATSATAWDVWELAAASGLDHPGGMQADGERLWIPLAGSRRKGPSVVRSYALKDLVPGKPLQPQSEFAVNDHIGALAVTADRQELAGASWDTEVVYIWDFQGRLSKKIEGAELAQRALGVVSGSNGRAGLAVQDWKRAGSQLFASGLFRGAGVDGTAPQSQIVIFGDPWAPSFRRQSIKLPKQQGTELSREGMAVANGRLYFLPDDLGSTNVIYSCALPARE